MMKSLVVPIFVSVIVVPAAFGQATRYDQDMPAMAIIGNTELSAELEAPGAEGRVSGRMSLNLAGSGKDLDQGIVRVRGFNVALFSVPQAAISGVEKPPQKEGVLGFATNSLEAVLRYDRDSGTLKGKIPGYIDSSYLATLIIERRIDKRAGGSDFFETVTQPAVLAIEIKLDKALAIEKGAVTYVNAIVNGNLTVDAMEYEKQSFPRYQISIREVEFPFEVVDWFRFEVAQRLCVQPVRIGRFRRLLGRWGWPFFVFETTGTGLAFGQPGASTQWAKADVVFTYREWKTLWKSSYWVTTDAGTEEEELRAEVDDDDCIEVFFVDDFDPEDAHGGGAAWGGGTAGSKIITSDANERYGVDFTHLAHELGHVIGLHHPWEDATANLYPASTGTLMCGSGFRNDNPTKNSQENKDNVSNPLLTFAFKSRTAGPDCQDDADCGACP